MSYHILHQFDEQWLAELKYDIPEKNKRKGLLDSFNDAHQQVRHASLGTRESKRLAIAAAGILLATFALLFSIDASHRAEAVQRVDALEQTAKK